MISLKPPSSVALHVEHFDLPALGLRRSACTFRTGRGRTGPPRRRRCRRGFPSRSAMRLASSPPMVMSSSSFHRPSRSSRSSGSSASASSRMSASSPVDHLAGLRRSASLSSLKRRYLVASLASEPCSRATAASCGRLGQHLGIDQLLLQLFEASQFFVEQFAHATRPSGLRSEMRARPEASRCAELP